MNKRLIGAPFRRRLYLNSGNVREASWAGGSAAPFPWKAEANRIPPLKNDSQTDARLTLDRTGVSMRRRGGSSAVAVLAGIALCLALQGKCHAGGIWIASLSVNNGSRIVLADDFSEGTVEEWRLGQTASISSRISMAFTSACAVCSW